MNLSNNTKYFIKIFLYYTKEKEIEIPIKMSLKYKNRYYDIYKSNSINNVWFGSFETQINLQEENTSQSKKDSQISFNIKIEITLAKNKFKRQFILTVDKEEIQTEIENSKKKNKEEKNQNILFFFGIIHQKSKKNISINQEMIIDLLQTFFINEIMQSSLNTQQIIINYYKGIDSLFKNQFLIKGEKQNLNLNINEIVKMLYEKFFEKDENIMDSFSKEIIFCYLLLSKFHNPFTQYIFNFLEKSPQKMKELSQIVEEISNYNTQEMSKVKTNFYKLFNFFKESNSNNILFFLPLFITLFEEKDWKTISQNYDTKKLKKDINILIQEYLDSETTIFLFLSRLLDPIFFPKSEDILVKIIKDFLKEKKDNLLEYLIIKDFSLAFVLIRKMKFQNLFEYFDTFDKIYRRTKKILEILKENSNQIQNQIQKIKINEYISSLELLIIENIQSNNFPYNATPIECLNIINDPKILNNLSSFETFLSKYIKDFIQEKYKLILKENLKEIPLQIQFLYWKSLIGDNFPNEKQTFILFLKNISQENQDSWISLLKLFQHFKENENKNEFFQKIQKYDKEIQYSFQKIDKIEIDFSILEETFKQKHFFSNIWDLYSKISFQNIERLYQELFQRKTVLSKINKNIVWNHFETYPKIPKVLANFNSKNIKDLKISIKELGINFDLFQKF
ncbi:hypothetical protein M0811_13849 [Anaeramoeba ignava]|uniref:Uncharacterized protein n=1 Tax=Anaeramoeba ignava TaxID=1746090 RepID=A0A9Q0LXP3_ANAIG|nr:hypothetical protein M0811_13849 [Anaeramoeba ignava]